MFSQVLSVTTTTEQELANIQKCLAAGYNIVIAIPRDAQTLRRLQTVADTALAAETLSRVRFLSPEDFIGYLDELAAVEASHEATVREYKVKVNYKPVSDDEAAARRQAISQIITKNIRRPKS